MTNNELIYLIQQGKDVSFNLKLLRENLSAESDNTEELIRDIHHQKNVKESIEKLYIRYIWVIVDVARIFSVGDYECLMQSGYLGLVDAIEHYKFDGGASFPTYARYWIYQSMHKSLESEIHCIRLPEYRRRLLLTYAKIVAEYQKNTGEMPTIAQMSLYLDIDESDASELQKSLYELNADSLDRELNADDESFTALELVASDTNIEDEVINGIYKDELKEIWDVVADLPDRKRKAAELRYKEGKTFEEVGKALNVSTSRAQEIHRTAIEELRKDSYINRIKAIVGDSATYNEGVKSSGLQAFRSSGTSATERTAFKRMGILI